MAAKNTITLVGYIGSVLLHDSCLVGGAQEDSEQGVGLGTVHAVDAKSTFAQACVGIGCTVFLMHRLLMTYTNFEGSVFLLIQASWAVLKRFRRSETQDLADFGCDFHHTSR